MEEVGVDNDFPTIAEFEKAEVEKPIPWGDVESITPFKVVEMNEIFTVNRNALIIEMKKSDDTIIKEWTTNIIKENLLKKQSCNRTEEGSSTEIENQFCLCM